MVRLNLADTGDGLGPLSDPFDDPAYSADRNGQVYGSDGVPLPPDPEEDDPGQEAAGPPGSWRRVDLGPFLRGEIEPPTPTVGLHRSDGLRLLYPGREHWINGETEAGKSWFALGCVMAELTAGNIVALVHFEEGDPSTTIDRLRSLGVPVQVLSDQLRFYAPTERARFVGALDDVLATPAPTLVVLDGVNEGMALHQQGVMEVEGTAAWRRLLVRPCTRAGAAVLQCDHVAKNPEGRGRYGFGSVHKTNGADGVVFSIENRDPFGRGRRGRSSVYIMKDRGGHLREHSVAKPKVIGKFHIGELVVDDTQTWSPDLELRFWAPGGDHTDGDEGDQPESASSEAAAVEARNAVIAALTAAEAAGRAVDSQRGLLSEVRSLGSFAKQRVTDALDDLVRDGRITVTHGRNRSKSYALTGASHDQEGK